MARRNRSNACAGQAVYEPFCGSGTTLIAAEIEGRTCHAIELSPGYVDVTIQRWQSFTGLEARLTANARIFAEVAVERLQEASDAGPV